MLLRGADQFIPEIRVRNADKHLCTLPGSAPGQIDSAEFGYNKIALAAGICHDFPVKVRQDPGTDRAVWDGYYVMNDAWFGELSYQILLDRKYFTPEQAAFDTEPIVLHPWDPMGSPPRTIGVCLL